MSNLIALFTAYLLSLNIPISGVALLVNPPTNPTTQVIIHYQASATQAQITQGNTAISSFNWAQQPPNPIGFIAALQADNTIQPIYYLLAPYQYTISQYSPITATAIQAIWAQLIAAYGSGPLTPTLQTTIQNYANTYNMPLVSL